MHGEDDIDHRAAARLWVTASLAAGAAIILDADQTHYLRAVLRLGSGAELLLFNGRDGEWLAQIETITKSAAQAVTLRQTRPQPEEIDVQLLFAPIKRARIEILIEKAVELGVSALVPIVTRRTIVARLNLDRLAAHAREAAEQTERLSVPLVWAPQPLETILETWPKERRLLLCDEGGTAPSMVEALQEVEPCPRSWAVLIGPEGGFEPAELDLVRAFPFATPVSLGPRVLRADTAAVAALAVFQAVRGDWGAARTVAPRSRIPCASRQR
jgi:16S rRNA (uracil1498-N3)-methyltransferase